MKNNDWEACKAELFAEQWWKDHGFTAVLKSRFITRSDYTVSKDGVTGEYQIVHCIKDHKAMMEHFQYHWGLLCQINQMKEAHV